MPLRSATTGQYITTPTQISQWPGQFGESNKVPTCVAYASDNRKPLWGFQAVRPHKHQQGSGVQWMRVKAFKKFLDPKISSTLEWPAPGRDVHEVTRDFLEGMYEHLMSVLAQGGFSEDVVDYHALFTVPAPFSIFAVEAFKRVIQTTGFGRHTFDVSLTEPEAAAIYTITSQQFIMRSPGHFNTSQCFLVSCNTYSRGEDGLLIPMVLSNRYAMLVGERSTLVPTR